MCRSSHKNVNRLIRMSVKFLPFLYVMYIALGENPPGNLTDLSLCKVSLLGVEYSGQIAKTESKVRCQSWTTKFPHNIPESLQNAQFSDGSKKKAKNFCRNPTKDIIMGPWCYSMNNDLQYETCGISLCAYSECKITGPGMEYSGKIKKSTTGK